MSEYKRKPNVLCTICRKPIYRRPNEILNNQRGLFCSQKCYGISQRKEISCIVCKQMILAGLNKKTCSRTCSNKNRAGIKYKSPGRPLKDKVKTYRIQKNRLMAERGKCCERCNYSEYQILHVHHIDRDRNHNDLENLELLCPNCHAMEHYLKK